MARVEHRILIGRYTRAAVIAIAMWLTVAGLSAASARGHSAAECMGSGGASANVRSAALQGVAVTSACNAWAVGAYENSTGTPTGTLVERWTGKAWRVETSRNPGADDALSGVAAVSARDAWAVGYSSKSRKGYPYRTLIEHWNGKAWQIKPSPGSHDAQLNGVAATSAGNGWAVGRRPGSTLVERWNGKTWKVQHSPNGINPGYGSNGLFGVAAVSARDAWAVGYGYDQSSDVTTTLIEHWNGSAWKVHKSPSPGRYPVTSLYGVAATSPTNAWAVGSSSNGFKTLIEHWNGKAWKVQRSASPGSGYNSLQSVAALSSKNAWAVGYYYKGAFRTLVEHWNGKDWKVQRSPRGGLYGVAAVSARDAWAVGSGAGGGALVQHWTGKAWER